MSLTITESGYVNALLNWLTGRPGPDGSLVTEERARDAAAELAAKANRTLMAGLDRDRLLAAWPMPIGVCSLCPARVPVAELVEHLLHMHSGVLVEHVPQSVPACTTHTLAGYDGPIAAPQLGCGPCHDAIKATEFDWSAVKVGDPDPTASINVDCAARLDEGDDGLWACSREAGHTGVHVAGDTETVCAVWS